MASKKKEEPADAPEIKGGEGRKIGADIVGFMKLEKGSSVTGRLCGRLKVPNPDGGFNRSFILEVQHRITVVRKGGEEREANPGDLIAINRAHGLRPLDSYPNALIRITVIDEQKRPRNRTLKVFDLRQLEAPRGSWPPVLEWGSGGSDEWADERPRSGIGSVGDDSDDDNVPF